MTTFEIEVLASRAAQQAHVHLEKGEFPHACELCGATPTALCVRRQDVDADVDASLKLGEVPFVRSYYYCPRHRSAAAALYEDFGDRA